MAETFRKKRLSAVEMEQLKNLCYEQLISDFRTQDFQINSPISGERGISQTYNFPLSVVRSTLDRLKEEEIIESVPRAGMRLKKVPPLNQSLKGMTFAFVAYMDKSKPEHIYNMSSVICHGMEELVRSQGASLHFLNTWQAPQGIAGIANTIIAEKYDAIAYGPDISIPIAEIQPLLDTSLPMVVFDRNVPGCLSVCYDDEYIGERVVSHLVELGHHKIAAIHFPDQEWSTNRIKSMIKKSKQLIGNAPDIFEFNHPPTFNQIKNLVETKCRNHSALFTGNDITASIVMECARNYGIRIPDDLSVIGVDDVLSLRYLNLTTIQLSPMALGQAGFELLKQALLNPMKKRNDHIKIKCPLIPRATTQEYRQENANLEVSHA